jgi:hypothetical protein
MGFLEEIGSVLEQYKSGEAVSREQAHQDYDTIADAVPNNVLGSVIGPALASLGSGEVETRIRNSATEMTPSVRSQFVRQLLDAVGGAGGNASSLLSRLGLNPSIAQQPQNASPDEVAKLATEVHKSHPDAFNAAMQFYSQHPTLVKVLGTLAIAKIAQHLSTRSH